MQCKKLCNVFSIIALSINYLLAFTMLSIWRNANICFIIAVVSSLFVAVILGDIGRIFLTIFGAYIVSAITSILAFVSPPLIYGSPRVQVEVGVLVAIHDITFASFFFLPLCIFVGILGSYISDKIPNPSR